MPQPKPSTDPQSHPPHVHLPRTSVPDRPLTVGIVVGEVSGDNLGAQLMQGLIALCPSVRFVGVGGAQMGALGLDSLIDMRRLSVMGFTEVVRHLPDLLKAQRQILSAFDMADIDVFVGIDAPDFNLRLAKRLKADGVYTVQYVSPSIWAWRESRIHTIKAATDLVLCLFPFELGIYAKYAHPAVCVGHPLFDTLAPVPPIDRPRLAEYLVKLIQSQTTISQQATNSAQQTISADELSDKTVLCLMAGSRTGEIANILPCMLEGVICWLKNQEAHISDQFLGILPVVSTEHKHMVLALIDRHAQAISDRLIVLSADECQDNTSQDPGFVFTEGQRPLKLGLSQSVMAFADLTVLASGTATLEAMLVTSPMVVLYKVNRLTYAIAKRMVKLSHVALPNILALNQIGSPIVPELIQDDAVAQRIAWQMQAVLTSEQRSALKDLRARLDTTHSDPAQALLDGYHRRLGQSVP